MQKRKCALVAATATLSLASLAPVQQRLRQADVGIQSLTVMTLNRELVSRIVVYAGMDDPSRAVHLEVLLPLGTEVIRMPDGCRTSQDTRTTDPTRGRVSCELGTLSVGDRREVTVTTSTPAAGILRTVAAYVSGDLPDPRPGDNFMVRTVP